MYHLNTETGKTGKCSASKGKCPFGGDENHFTTPEAARAAFERNQTSFQSTESSKWSPKQLQVAIDRVPGLRGIDFEGVKENLLEDYERAKNVKLDKTTLFKSYATSTVPPEELYIEYDFSSPNGPFLMKISATIMDYEYTGEPVQILRGLRERREEPEDDYYQYYYEVELSPADGQQAKDSQLAKQLEGPYSMLKDPDYPDWMIFERFNHYGYSSAFYGTRKIAEGLASDKESLKQAEDARDTKPIEKKIQVLQQEKLEAEEAITQLSSPKLKALIRAEVKAIDTRIQRQEQMKLSRQKKSSPEELKKRAKAVEDKQRAYDQITSSATSTMRDLLIKRLAEANPLSPGRARAAATKWIDSHPSLVAKELAKLEANGWK